jgi:putative transcriptional regulator
MKNNIKTLRKEIGLRQEDMAKNLKVTRQTIIAVENDKYDPSLILAMRISNMFGKTVEEIFKIE